MWVGQAGAGSRLKLVTNNWILAVVEATAETVALAEGLGREAGGLPRGRLGAARSTSPICR